MLDEKHNNNYYGRSNTHVCSNHQTEHNYYSRNHNEIRLFSCSSQHKLTLRATNLMLLFTWPHSRKWSMQSMLQTSSALITQTNVFEKTFVDYQSMMGRCASNIAQQGPKMARRAYNRGYQCFIDTDTTASSASDAKNQIGSYSLQQQQQQSAVNLPEINGCVQQQQ